MNKKKIAIITSVIVLLILAIIGASYAFYSATVKENNKTQTVIKTNELTIVYTGTEEINVSDIVPGDSFTKKFTVENTSNIPVTYNIYIEGITNEFNEALVYTLKDKDGEVIAEEVLPSTNAEKTYLITDIEIDSSELKEYEMTIEFKYSDEDQNKLQGKSFNATLGIDTTPVKIVKVVNDKLELDKLNSVDTVTKTFAVKNLSKEIQSYDLKLSDVVSTYGDNLTYSLTKNETEVISNETMPTSDTTILESQIISANTTDEYVMTIKFDNTTAALDYIIAAENDEFSANINIEKKGEVEKICYLSNDENNDSIADIGDMITCDTESFYVYSNDNETIKMLAQYNLYVGGMFNPSNSSYTAYGSEATELQDSNMIGYTPNQTIYSGVLSFSNDDTKGVNYSTFEGSIVEKKVDAYAMKLSKIGVNTIDVTLITKTEIDGLAKTTLTSGLITSKVPEWLYGKSYWTRSEYDKNYAWYIDSRGYLDHYHDCKNNKYFGIRPVVYISVNELK
ncbi:MAG: hypothetical protein J6B89_04940 [Bacilli bacterium]|nr:hypothetical protein [Bacilli bacterium]